MREEEYEGYLDPKGEATVDERAIDGVPRRTSFEQYLRILAHACQRVDRLYFNVPTVTEIMDTREYLTVSRYRERVYCYELYYHQRRLLEESGMHEQHLLLNAETDKSGTVYSQWIGRRKPDFILHRPGEGRHNIGITEVKRITGPISEIEADLQKLKCFLNPRRMNYFGAVSLIYGDDASALEAIRGQLRTSFGRYWPMRFKALWHRTPGSPPRLWDAATGEFRETAFA